MPQDTASYEDNVLVRCVIDKTKNYRSSVSNSPCGGEAAPWVAGLLAAYGEVWRPLNILDFGGAAGAHYHQFAGKFPHVPLNWAVVETPAMASYCAADPALRPVRFYDSVASATQALGTVDVVIASSSLQYTPDPMAALAELLGLKARWLGITRMPLWDGPVIRCMQRSTLSANGPGPLPPGFEDRMVEYPLVLPNIAAFQNSLESQGYVRVLQTGEQPAGITINGQPILQYQWLFRRA
ncbi:methyltransferase, TIGR04325 family [Azospirillum sp.]|uniref:methyltransferase, TIGR04325 family n=1 Tax=Azospirillum sp. TaxID=34012 RepID=UPI002D4AD682|nr:methyltransferase, TIGR04325 family [Azospirillum sp.]HYD70480.1 methyltransferase, TIGR04325 family [Azospirillum sp.]